MAKCLGPCKGSSMLVRRLSEWWRGATATSSPVPHPDPDVLATQDIADLMRRRGWEGKASGKSLVASRHDRDAVIGTFVGSVISTLHFRSLDTLDERQRAFRDGVRYIDLEAFSQCNRR